MRGRLLWIGLASLAAAVACAPPAAGNPCHGSGFDCADAHTALECRTGTWTALPCRGPDGCSHQGSSVRCDFSADLAGDACPLSKENEGLCGPQGRSVLQCRAGTLVTTATCSTCAVDADAGVVRCTP